MKPCYELDECRLEILNFLGKTILLYLISIYLLLFIITFICYVFTYRKNFERDNAIPEFPFLKVFYGNVWTTFVCSFLGCSLFIISLLIDLSEFEKNRKNLLTSPKVGIKA